MFTQFMQPEGLPVLIRTSRIVAFARTEDGQTRIFLGGAFSILVQEDEVAVLDRLGRSNDAHGEPPY